MPLTDSAVWPGSSGNTPWRTASSAEPIAADIVIAPARMPPAAPSGRSKNFVRYTAPSSPRIEQNTARMTNFSPSPLRLFMNDGPTRRPTPYMNR